MKKFFIFTLLTLAIGLCFLFNTNNIVYATTDGNLISTNTTICQDINIVGNYTNYFRISNNSTLEIKDCKITGSDNEITNLFYVESGSTLILDNVTISGLTMTYCIYNLGKVNISNSQISKIYNLSTQENSLSLFNNVSVNNITIRNNYITVYENTSILNTISITALNEFDTKLVVKSANSKLFANKLIKNFKLLTRNDFYLDYVGDNCTVTNDYDELLCQGDIIISQASLDLNDDGTLDTGLYCTGNNLLESFANEKQYPVYKMSSTVLNNITYHTEDDDCGYEIINNTSIIELELNLKYEDGNIYKTTDYVYASGSNRAIFIDIPAGYEVNTALTHISNSALNITDYHINEYYMRPVILYTLGRTYSYVSCTINITLIEKTPIYASLIIDKEDNVIVNHSDNMIIGCEYTFEIDKSDNYLITKVVFNGNEVLLEENDDTFTFSSIVDSINNLKIYSLKLPYTVVITPNNFTFKYNEEINLQQNYFVAETQETILVTFARTDNNEIGTYPINEATCDNINYIVTIAEGEYYYSITKISVSSSEIILKENENFTYNENLQLTADMFIIYIPSYLSLTMITEISDLTVGTQEIYFLVGIEDDNYVVIDSSTIYTTITINPQEINIDSYSITFDNDTYDGTRKNILISNIDAHLVGFTENIYFVDGSNLITKNPINAGKYYIEVSLTSKSEFYALNNSHLNSYLEIYPKTISVSLVKSVFEYNETIPTIEFVVSELINDDIVNITHDNFDKSSVGKHKINIFIDNTNYVLQNNYVELEIQKIKVILSSVTFENTTVTYNGENQIPNLVSELPSYIQYKFNNVSCKHVGTYNLICSFLSTDDIHSAPDDIIVVFNIIPKNITVKFNPLEDSIANGQAKYINVEFLGVISGDSVEYTISYLGDCILPGTYECFVNLKNSPDYNLIGETKHSFIIYAKTTSYVSNDINLILEGKFTEDNKVNISNTTTNSTVIRAIANIDYKSYSSIQLTYDNYSTEPVIVKIQNISNMNTKNLTIYKLVDNNLQKINYTISNGLISFEIQGTELIVFVEENGISGLLIFLITLVSALTISGVITFFILKKRKKIK